MTRAELGKDPTRAPPSPQLNLPAGFRFYPTDEELVVHYLCRKADSHPFPVPIIAEIELYKFDPWDLPEKALFGEREWYFFSPRDRKYPNGSRPNRAAGTGYWKATGTDKPICSKGKKVGVKKALVFYKGKAPKGEKTNWIMHEYRLAETSRRRQAPSSSHPNNNKSTTTFRLDDWVLCRIYKKSSSAAQKAANALESESSSLDERLVDGSPEIDEVVSDAMVDEIPSDLCEVETRATAQDVDKPMMLSHLLYQQPRQSSSSLEASYLASNELSYSPLESSSPQEADSDVNSRTLGEFPTINANANTSVTQSSIYNLDFSLPSPSSMLAGAGLIDSDLFFSSFPQLFDHRNHLMM